MEKPKIIKEILFTKEEIIERSKQLALEINEYYKKTKPDKPVIVVGILKSCLPFMVSLMEYFDFDCETDFMIISTYAGGIKSSGSLQLILDLNRPVKDRHLLIIEDILETGKTLSFVDQYLKIKKVKEVKKVVLLDRVNRTKPAMSHVDWKAFDIKTDDFVIGFGFDCREQLRSLPYIGSIDMKEYEKALKEG